MLTLQVYMNWCILAGSPIACHLHALGIKLNMQLCHLHINPHCDVHVHVWQYEIRCGSYPCVPLHCVLVSVHENFTNTEYM